MDWRGWKGCVLSVSGEAVEVGAPHLIIESGEPPPTVPVEVVPAHRLADAHDALEVARTTLAMARSVILSGERMSTQAEGAFDMALAAIRAVRA